MNAQEYDYDGEAPRFWFSSRFALAVLGFVGFLSMSSQRTCMNVAMVCLLNQSALAILDRDAAGLAGAASSYDDSHEAAIFNRSGKQPLSNGVAESSSNSDKICNVPEFFALNSSEFSYLWETGEFVWSESRQNIVFDTFSWGFIAAQVPGGWLAQRFGGKKIFGFFLLAGSISTALIPIASRNHFYLLLTLRFLGGAGSGGTFPAMHTLWGKWAPPLERSLLASITYAGSLTGSVFIYPVAGLLCKYGFDGKGFDGGWPSIFYIFGALGVVWFVLWMIFSSESPADHGRISDEERVYIEETLLSETAKLGFQSRLNIPWSKFATSFPFAAIVLCNFTYEWGVYTIEKLFPKSMKEIHSEIRLTDGFSLLPYFGLWFLVMASGFAADRLQSHGVLNTGTTRKLMQTIGTIIPAGIVAAMGFIDCRHWPIAFKTIGLSFCGFQYNGFLVNHLDIAPQFAGILMGIASAIGSTASFLVPSLHNVIKEVSKDELEQWQTMFLITASFFLFSMFFFLLCGSGKLQDWAIIDEFQDDNETNESSPFNSRFPLGAATNTKNQNPLYAKELSIISNQQMTGAVIPEIYPGGDTLRRADDTEAKTLRRSSHTGSLPRSNMQTGSLPPRSSMNTGSLPKQHTITQNHLSPAIALQQQQQQEHESLKRKSSNKSTNSSKSNDEQQQQQQQQMTSSRTDHERQRKRGERYSRHQERDRDRDIDRDRERERERDRERDFKRTGSSKRNAKPSPPKFEESLDIYESLSESPV